MSSRGWLAFVGVSVLWGIPYLLIKVVVDDGVSPAFLAWSRIALGAAVLLAVSWRAGLLRDIRRRLPWLATFGIVELAIPFPLIGFGEQRVDSSLAAILIATAPLFVALLALRFDASERVSGLRLFGLLIGLAGVAALVGIDVSGSADELLGAAAILCAAVGYAVGPMILKRHLGDLDSRVAMGVSLAIAAVVLSPAAVLDHPAAMPSATAVGAIVALGVLCTATALVLYGMLVVLAGAGRALLVTYINPLIATAVGFVILDERPGAGTVLGLLLILAGSWITTGTRLPRRRIVARGRVAADGRADRGHPPVTGPASAEHDAAAAGVRDSSPGVADRGFVD